MIALLDTSEDLAVCQEQLGAPVEQLLTPLTRFKRQGSSRSRFAIDNGAFSGFRMGEFRGLLLREKDAISQCRFVAVPDVVGSARRTLEVFDHWKYQLASWPLALVAQDGLEDLEVPWSQIKAVFIGGSTRWKLGAHAANVIRAAKAIGKLVHVGRVNTPERWLYFDKLGADSVDGTGISQYSHMREAICAALHRPNLLTDLAPGAASFSHPPEDETFIAGPAEIVTSASGNGNEGSDCLEV